jgi:hypothetical protein
MKKFILINTLCFLSFSTLLLGVKLEDFPESIRKYMRGHVTPANPEQESSEKGQPALPRNQLVRVSTISDYSFPEILEKIDSLFSLNKPLSELINEFKKPSHHYNSDGIVSDHERLLEMAINYLEKYSGSDAEAARALENNMGDARTIEKEKAVYRLVIAMIIDDQKVLLFRRKNFKIPNLAAVANFLMKYEERVGKFDDLIMENFLALPK